MQSFVHQIGTGGLKLNEYQRRPITIPPNAPKVKVEETRDYYAHDRQWSKTGGAVSPLPSERVD
jgi:hypothetical protein